MANKNFRRFRVPAIPQIATGHSHVIEVALELNTRLGHKLLVFGIKFRWVEWLSIKKMQGAEIRVKQRLAFRQQSHNVRRLRVPLQRHKSDDRNRRQQE